MLVIEAWPKVVLKPSRIHPLVRQGGATRANMSTWTGKGSPAGCQLLNQPGYAHATEWLPRSLTKT